MSFRHPLRAARLAALCLIAQLAFLAAPHAAYAVGTADGFVSVGTTTNPTSEFGVYGGATIGTSYNGTLAPTNGLLVQGNVGIGTTAPQSMLHIQAGEVQVGSSGASCATANQGAIRYNGGILYYCDNASTWETLDSSGAVDTGDYYIATQTATPTTGQGMFGGSTTLGGVLAGYGSTADVTLENRSNTPALEVLGNSTNIYIPGNVGIGTTVPLSALDIHGGSSAFNLVDGVGHTLNLTSAAGLTYTSVFTIGNGTWGSIATFEDYNTYASRVGMLVKGIRPKPRIWRIGKTTPAACS